MRHLISVKLSLMSRRSGHLWALGACVALAVVLVFGCHSGSAAGAVAGMSAPTGARHSVRASIRHTTALSIDVLHRASPKHFSISIGASLGTSIGVFVRS